VNYALRGLRIPAGYSEIQFIFRPKSVYIGRQIAVIFSSISLVMLGFVMFKGLKNALNEQPAEIKKEKMATPVLPKKKK
jgi:hypothetical protein